MTLKLSTAVRNNRLQALKDALGATVYCVIYSGTVPADGGVNITTQVALATMLLPNPCLNTPSAGAISKTGTWSDNSANAAGTATFFRIFAHTPTAGDALIQGTVGTSGADMIVDSTAFLVGQVFTVTSFTITDNNS